MITTTREPPNTVPHIPITIAFFAEHGHPGAIAYGPYVWLGHRDFDDVKAHILKEEKAQQQECRTCGCEVTEGTDEWTTDEDFWSMALCGGAIGERLGSRSWRPGVRIS
jgi:hypothetical protein